MRARNMQALTDDTKAEFPGIVIGGKGDPAHQEHASDHNEDDTPGSKPAQSDADDVPEHRAIDPMIGPAFTKADAQAYVEALLADPAALARLAYIIWNRSIWSRKNGWQRQDYTGSDPHTNHVHVSGHASDDENAASWPAVKGLGMAYSEAQMRAFAWQYSGRGIGENNGTTVQRATLSYFDEVLRTVRLIASKVEIDETELAAIQAAAEAGAKEAFEESAEEFVAAIVGGVLAGLDPADLTMEAVRTACEEAVRNVLVQGVGSA